MDTVTQTSTPVPGKKVKETLVPGTIDRIERQPHTMERRPDDRYPSARAFADSGSLAGRRREGARQAVHRLERRGRVVVRAAVRERRERRHALELERATLVGGAFEAVAENGRFRVPQILGEEA